MQEQSALKSSDSLKEPHHIDEIQNERKSTRKVKKIKTAKASSSRGCLLTPTSSFSENDYDQHELKININEAAKVNTPVSTLSNRDECNIASIEASHGAKSTNESKKSTLESPQRTESDEKKKMYDMLQAITESYRGIQTRLDVVGDGMKQSAVFVQSNWRNVERLLIALLLIPAFVMSTIAIYRQSDKGYNFDLGEIQKEQMYYIALKNFDAWNEALISQDSARISVLYATDLSFLPTMSDQFVVSTRSEDKYFLHFVEQQPAGIIVEDKVQPLGTDAYLHTGLYNFIIMSNYTAAGFSQVLPPRAALSPAAARARRSRRVEPEAPRGLETGAALGDCSSKSLLIRAP